LSQNFTDDVYSSGHVAATDLQNIENNFAAIKSGFSGSASPSNPVAGMRWCDTTNLIPRLRDSSNAAWLAFLTGDASQKLWIYRNDSVEGWAVDATVTDVCLAVKGGSQAYNVNGGNLAGSWTQPNHGHTANSHNHKWYDSGGATSTDHTYNSGGGQIELPTTNKNASLSNVKYFTPSVATGISGTSNAFGDSWTNNETVTINGSAPASTYRPRAAIGTMQYPDI